MSAGWESLLRITKASSWGTPGTLGNRGFFLYAESHNLDFGAQVMERDNKMLGVAESPVDTFSVDRYQPRGDFVFQPKADDMLMILMAHFQNVAKSGTGTYTFYRLPTGLKWTSGGSNIGTHPYSINIDLVFGQSFVDAGGTQSNGIRFTNGIVDRLTFDLRYGEDCHMTPSFKFMDADYYTYPSVFIWPSVYGSLSAYNRFVDYMGTATTGTEGFNIESLQSVFNNNSADRTKIGQRGYSRFPFGKWTADGSLNFELERDIAKLQEGIGYALTIDVFEAAGNEFKIAQSNIRHRAFPIPVSGGDSIIELSIPYRAYPNSGTTGPSTMVTVYTGSTFGTDLLGF